MVSCNLVAKACAPSGNNDDDDDDDDDNDKLWLSPILLGVAGVGVVTAAAKANASSKESFPTMVWVVRSINNGTLYFPLIYDDDDDESTNL